MVLNPMSCHPDPTTKSLISGITCQFYSRHKFCLTLLSPRPWALGKSCFNDDYISNCSPSFFIYINLFVYLLAVLGLCCCVEAFSSCGEQGLLFHCGARASHCGGFSCCGARALGARASVVVARGLSCPMACGIFLDQGSNPCPLHWQADS